MPWYATVLMSVGGTLVTGGVIAAVAQWIKARAKKVEAEADALKTEADTSAETKKAEVTAKVKLIEAEALEKKTDAEMDAAFLEEFKEYKGKVDTLEREIAECRADHAKCETDRTAEKLAREELQARVEVLEMKNGLTTKP